MNYRNIFLYIKRHKYWPKHYRVQLHGIDMRDTYTNSIINNSFKAQTESDKMTYAV